MTNEPERPMPGIVEFPVRLNRYISACGASSRRKADRLIVEGRVTVDGAVEKSLGRVLTAPAAVCVDGEPISQARPVCIVMNKPRGVLSAVGDARERTVIDLLPEFYRPLGLFPVGRLDKESEGLIILTNDGVLAHDIMHPSKEVRRIYLVWMRRDLSEAEIEKWRAGFDIDGRFTKPLEVERGEFARSFSVVLGEGYKREIRLMAAELGNRVSRLKRIGIGRLFLKNLPVGTFCEYNCLVVRDMIAHGGEV